jgi:hypothetical protein
MEVSTRQIGRLDDNSLVGEALDREQVIGHPIAETVFAVCDLIFLRDDPIAELHEPHHWPSRAIDAQERVAIDVKGPL